MSLTFYGYSKCSTSRNAEKWLAQHEISYQFVDVVGNPPAKEELGELVRRSGQDIRKFFNTSGEAYRGLRLKDKLGSMSEEEMLLLLASNGKLIKRPVVTDGVKATAGFQEDRYREVWLKP